MIARAEVMSDECDVVSKAVGRSGGRAVGSVAEQFGLKGADSDLDPPVCYDARWCNAGTGRFMSGEPIEHDTENAYRYVNTNPRNCVDPTGMWQPAPS